MTSLTAMKGDAVSIPADAIQALKTAFKGPILTADDPAYEDTRQIWNAMIERRPGMIVRCTGTVDVVQAVSFARKYKLLVSVGTRLL